VQKCWANLIQVTQLNVTARKSLEKAR